MITQPCASRDHALNHVTWGVSRMVKMASTSRQCIRTDAELENILATLESEDEYSEISEYESDHESEDNNSAEVPESDDSDGDEVLETCAQGNPPLFKWRSDVFIPTVHNFENNDAGISEGVILDGASYLDFFQLFFPENIMQEIANETNKYYIFLTQKNPPTPNSRLKQWVDTTAKELYIFFAITMLMVRAKKLAISDYWSTDSLIATPQFSEYMSRDRYLLLLRLLHFSDNNNQPEGDRLYKMRPIVDHLRKTFSEVFSPFQNLCIDERLTLFKGRLSFIQYIPSKRHRFGIKSFVICDCETGYILIASFDFLALLFKP